MHRATEAQRAVFAKQSKFRRIILESQSAASFTNIPIKSRIGLVRDYLLLYV